MPRHVLVVEPHVACLLTLQQRLRDVAVVDGCSDFVAARRRLLLDRPEILVTNLRLGAFNGLHLVYLAAPFARSIVYMDEERADWLLLHEAQRAGAFVETPERLVASAASYLCAELPANDRRDRVRYDRRQIHRGGRRAADMIVVS